MRIGSMEWMPPMGDYRSGPVRPRWSGPGWGTVAVAGLVVAAMGWAVFAGDAEAPTTGGAISGAREEAPAVLDREDTAEEAPLAVAEEEPQERVPVSWGRKTGTRPTGVKVWTAEPAVERAERTRTRPQEPAKRERRAARPERKSGPAKRADRGRRAERAGPVEARRTMAARSAAASEGSLFSRLVGGECERQLPGAGPICSMLLDEVFAGGQAHGGR